MKLLMKPIDAIVVFKGSGKPLPYKFRYTDTEGISREVYVKRILTAAEEKFAGIPVYVYDCQSEIGGAERRYQLKYFIPECRWELFKL
ncbi:MAG: hypothetical protein J6A42_03115 [Firmicutes bacterium]|nr:hypothetical protein [Bacillota bacterium]MBQ2096398.1 hypothetical protein [Bacillota bacterium]